MSNRSPNSPEPARGVYVALATPRKAGSLEADAAALLDFIDTIVQTGVDGLVLFGSTGEFVHYDLAERMRVLSLAIKRSRVPLMVNVSHSSFDGTVALAENAAESGAAGVLVMPPHFFRYSDEQIFAFYIEIAKAVQASIPIYLYNIPFFTNPLSSALMQRLLATGFFAGIKDSSGDWGLFEAIQSVRSKSKFQSLIGNDALYSRALAAGADGVVSGVAAAIPELMLALDRSVTGKAKNNVEVLERRVAEFAVQIDCFPATIAIKQAAVVRGWKLDNAAIPFDDDTRNRLQEFRRWFEQWLPDVLKESVAT